MPAGTIKTIMDRGYGFIEAESGSERESEIFFHSSVVVGIQFDALQVGQAVDYEVEQDPRNPGRTRASPVELQQ